MLSSDENEGGSAAASGRATVQRLRQRFRRTRSKLSHSGSHGQHHTAAPRGASTFLTNDSVSAVRASAISTIGPRNSTNALGSRRYGVRYPGLRHLATGTEDRPSIDSALGPSEREIPFSGAPPSDAALRLLRTAVSAHTDTRFECQLMECISAVLSAGGHRRMPTRCEPPREDGEGASPEPSRGVPHPQLDPQSAEEDEYWCKRASGGREEAPSCSPYLVGGDRRLLSSDNVDSPHLRALPSLDRSSSASSPPTTSSSPNSSSPALSPSRAVPIEENFQPADPTETDSPPPRSPQDDCFVSSRRGRAPALEREDDTEVNSTPPSRSSPSPTRSPSPLAATLTPGRAARVSALLEMAEGHTPPPSPPPPPPPDENMVVAELADVPPRRPVPFPTSFLPELRGSGRLPTSRGSSRSRTKKPAGSSPSSTTASPLSSREGASSLATDSSEPHKWAGSIHRIVVAPEPQDPPVVFHHRRTDRKRCLIVSGRSLAAFQREILKAVVDEAVRSIVYSKAQAQCDAASSSSSVVDDLVGV